MVLPRLFPVAKWRARTIVCPIPSAETAHFSNMPGHRRSGFIVMGKVPVRGARYATALLRASEEQKEEQRPDRSLRSWNGSTESLSLDNEIDDYAELEATRKKLVKRKRNMAMSSDDFEELMVDVFEVNARRVCPRTDR